MLIPDNIPEGVQDGKTIRAKVNELLENMREDSKDRPTPSTEEPSSGGYIKESEKRAGSAHWSEKKPESPAPWSNKEKPVKEWAPMPGRPGYFTDPQGIMQNVARGEVPKEILERFSVEIEPITKEEESE